jgi:hypothetical protein
MHAIILAASASISAAFTRPAESSNATLHKVADTRSILVMLLLSFRHVVIDAHAGCFSAAVSIGIFRSRLPVDAKTAFGFGTLSIAIAALQVLLDRGEQMDWFGSGEIWIEAIVAASAFYLFLVHTQGASAGRHS